MVLSGWQHLLQKNKTIITDGIIQDRVGGGPYHLEIQPTNKCNLNCFFCITKHCHLTGPTTLAWPLLETLLTQLARKDLRMLRLSGGGEPLIYQNIQALLDLMGQKNIRLVDLNTNGTQLKPLAAKLVDVGTDVITISLNEPTARQYGKTMGVKEDMFDRVLEGIATVQTASELKPPAERPIIRVQFFMHQGNWRQIPEMVALGKQINADQIFIRTLIFRPAEERISAAHLPEIKNILSEVMRQDAAGGPGKLILDLSQESELHLFTYDKQLEYYSPEDRPSYDFEQNGPRIKYCIMPWYTAVIGANGMVFPCCMLMNTELGNINTQPWDEIWDGPRYRRIRHELKQLMLQNGQVDYSRKLHQCLSPQCLSPHGCQWSYDLCDPDFYKTTSDRVNKETPCFARYRSSMVHNLFYAARHVYRYFKW